MLQPAVPQRDGRPKESALKAVLAVAGIRDDQALDILSTPDPARLRVLNPTALAVQTVRAREEHGLNLLAAEVIGAALTLEEPIRLSATNAGGLIHRSAIALALDIAIVDLVMNERGMLSVQVVETGNDPSV